MGERADGDNSAGDWAYAQQWIIHGGVNCLNSVPYRCYTYRRFNAIVSQLKMHYFSEGAFESLIASQLLKKEKYI